MLKWFNEIGSGFIVGTTDIIPGISGGTVLFLLGLYERTIAAISHIKPAALITLIRHAVGIVFGKNRKGSFRKFTQHAQLLDLPFLTRLLTGVVTAILLLSSLLKYMLENHYSYTFAFIFGLILASVVFATRMLKVKKPIHIIHFITGVAVAVMVISSVNPIDTAVAKSERYRIRFEETVTVEQPESPRFKYAGVYSAKELAVAGMSGAVAICATIMPGPSGSLVLILLGQYYEALTAISNLKTLQLDYFAFLAVMAMGMGIGMLAFSRVINYVLKRFYNGAVAFMIGVTTGSLYALWPFKAFEVLSLYQKEPNGAIILNEFVVVRTNTPIIPDNTGIILIALLLCGLGVLIMVFMERFGAKKN